MTLTVFVRFTPRETLEMFLRAKNNQLEKNEMISLIKHNMVYVNHFK